MTNQEAFDAMCRHLLGMRDRAQDVTGGCRYRFPDGRRCAVGALIPDEEYDESFERKRAAFIVDKCPSLRGLDGAMLCAVQEVHDFGTWRHGRPTQTTLNNLRSVARDYGLSAAVLDTAP